VSPWQVVRLGNRIPIPVAGPAWALARTFAELAGAPVPPQVVELMCKGRAADGSRARAELGLGELTSTRDVCVELYEWATVTQLPVSQVVA